MFALLIEANAKWLRGRRWLWWSRCMHYEKTPQWLRILTACIASIASTAHTACIRVSFAITKSSTKRNGVCMQNNHVYVCNSMEIKRIWQIQVFLGAHCSNECSAVRIISVAFTVTHQICNKSLKTAANSSINRKPRKYGQFAAVN